ncbi:MAG: DUF1704 domain-containing protein [Candidatus Latescibacterota bacterium]|jgi:uncharacterized protein (TIGR02421 family)
MSQPQNTRNPSMTNAKQRGKRPQRGPNLDGLTDAGIAEITERLAENKRIRRVLNPWGKLHIDRQLPFICVYRRPVAAPVPGADRLILSEAAYLNAPAGRRYHRSIVTLIQRVGELMAERFGAFLVLELWTSDAANSFDPKMPQRPGFKIHRHPRARLDGTVHALERGLRRVKAMKRAADVSVQVTTRIAPPGMPPLLHERDLRGGNHYLLGLEVKPVFVDPNTSEVFPLLLRRLRRRLTQVLGKTFFEFAHERTTHSPPHYHSLGRRAVVKAVWKADEQLAEVSNSFDLLFEVTPVNAESAWKAFRRSRFETAPEFLYRPRTIDPGLVKRDLFDIRIERVEDPTLTQMFLAKQSELDRQLTLLSDRGTARFRYGSLQLHGEVRPPLVETAKRILKETPTRSRAGSARGALDSTEFVTLAQTEIERYSEVFPDFKATATVSDGLYSGLLVSRGQLLVGKSSRIPRHRAEALIQHEVGTHLLTYFNGRAQPFKMLYTGLPGYDEMQEGLAVLAEYLVGGLTPDRMRVLAARVVAARALVDGASFVDTFRKLNRDYRIPQKTAFTITMRLYRGGGLLKDAVYLRGLIAVLDYFAAGGELDVLFIGKIAARHIAVIEELLLRKILTPPPLLPRYLEFAEAKGRLEALRRGVSVHDLLHVA